MKKQTFKTIIMVVLLALLPLAGIHAAKKKTAVQNDREYWCALAYRMAQPVL